MKTLDEIETEYEDSFEFETKQFKDKLVLVKKLSEKKVLERKYKIQIKKVISKYENGVRKFAKKNPQFILGEELKKKKKILKKFKPFSVVPIDLKQSWFARTKVKSSYFFFRLNLFLKKFFRLILPLSFHYLFYRIKFLFQTLKDDFIRTILKVKSKSIKFIIKHYKKITLLLVNVWSKFMKLVKKILPVKEKKTEKDILAENRERIKTKS